MSPPLTPKESMKGRTGDIYQQMPREEIERPVGEEMENEHVCTYTTKNGQWSTLWKHLYYFTNCLYIRSDTSMSYQRISCAKHYMEHMGTSHEF